MSEIKASALVYCRTYYCDYDSGFLLRPEDFYDNDVAWAKSYIMSATSYCDGLTGIRRVVFGNEKFLVFGIVGILDELLEKVMLDNNEIKQYAFDEHGRNVKCFIGYVCHMPDKDSGGKPLIKTEDFGKIFCEHIAKEDVWKSRSLQRIQIGYEYALEMEHCPHTVDDRKREYISGDKEDREIFDAVLARISSANPKVSLCTNLYNVKMLQDQRYTKVTAKKSVIERYKKSAVSEINSNQSISEECIKKKNLEDEKDAAGQNINESMNINKVIFIVSLIIVVVLLILFCI